MTQGLHAVRKKKSNDESRVELRTVTLSNVLIVAGPAASGKTTFATQLASRLSYSLFDLDQVTGPLVKQCLALLGQPDHALDEDLGQALRPARYESLLSAATANVVLGRDVVIAAPFSRETRSQDSWRDMVARWSPPLANDRVDGVRTELIFVECPAPLLRERLAHRGEPRDLLKIKTGVDLSTPFPRVNFHPVDGTADAEHEVERLLAELDLKSVAAGPAGS